MKIFEARQCLRDADPVGSERLPAWPNESARVTLRAILADPIADGVDDSIADEPAGRRARKHAPGRTLTGWLTSRWWLVPTGAAAAVVAVSVTVAVTVGGRGTDLGSGSGSPAITAGAPQGSPRASGASPPATAPSKTPPSQARTTSRPTSTGPASSTDVANRAATERAVSDLLKLVPILPGAKSTDRSPVPALDGPPELPGSANVIRQTRWWTAPGTVDAALGTTEARAKKAGLTVRSEGSAGGPGIDFHYLVLVRVPSKGGMTDSPAYVDLELVVGVVKAGDGVAVRADSQAVWMPASNPAARIPATVTSVDVVVEGSSLGPRPGSPLAHRVLTGTAVHHLADVVNELTVAQPGGRSCPSDAGYTDVLTFTGPGTALVVTAEVGGCQGVTVATDRPLSPSFVGGGQVDKAVMDALGLVRAKDGSVRQLGSPLAPNDSRSS